MLHIRTFFLFTDLSLIPNFDYFTLTNNSFKISILQLYGQTYESACDLADRYTMANQSSVEGCTTEWDLNSQLFKGKRLLITWQKATKFRTQSVISGPLMVIINIFIDEFCKSYTPETEIISCNFLSRNFSLTRKKFSADLISDKLNWQIGCF